MKYPLDSNHKEETPVTNFIPGKWYRCIKESETLGFKTGKVYLCISCFGIRIVNDFGISPAVPSENSSYQFALEE